MKHFNLLTTLLLLSVCASAQIPYNMQYGSYLQNFNSLANSGTSSNLLPSGWALYETGSNANADYSIGTGSSTAGDSYSFGAANSADRALGGLLSGSLTPTFGFGFRNNTGYNLVSINVSATMEQWRASNSVDIDSCYFYFSTNASGIDDTAATWTRFAACDLYSAVNPNTGSALDGNLPANQLAVNGIITVNLAIGDTIFMKWVDINITGADDGLAIDNLSLTLNDINGPIPAGPPTIVSTTPADNAQNVPLTTNSLAITLDNPIASLGAGSVTLTNLTNSSATNVSGLTFSGTTLTISGITLTSNTDYAVQIDSGKIITTNGAFHGIKDSSTWNFKTENTTPPPAVTSLNETFTACNDPVFGVFKAYSALGNEEWRCTTFGRNDSNAVRMNGYANGGNRDNEDWLISPPLDFSGMTSPQLNFWSKLRFPASNIKEVMVSTNYSGLGDPTLANWTALQVNGWATLDTNWKQFTNTDLTPYKASNFFIAFKYSSDTSDADEWSLDDIIITNGNVSTSFLAGRDIAIKVLGDVGSQLTIQLSAAEAANLDYAILDISGRRINSGSLSVLAGKQIYQIDADRLSSGVYLLQIRDAHASHALKFLVK